MKIADQNIVYDKYLLNYELMLDYLNNNKKNTIAFLGAGLSAKHNYKTWYKLILGMDQNGNKVNNALVDFADIPYEEYSTILMDDGNYNLLEIANKCHIKMGDNKWREFIKNEYDNFENIILDPNDPYIHILKSNFHCFITTNFDGCLFKFAEFVINNIGIAVYPFNLAKVQEKTINYLHGAGFEIIKDYEPNIVLTSQQYQEAYRNPQLYGFLSNLLYYHIVFFGFSMDDQYLESIFDHLEKGKETAKRAHKNTDSSYFDRERFIILPFLPQKLKSDINYKDTQLKDMIEEEDKIFLQKGLKVIRYKKIGSDYFSTFNSLMENIHSKAPNPNLLARPIDLDEIWSKR